MGRALSYFQFKHIGARLGAAFSVVIVILLVMVAITGAQLYRIEALNAGAALDGQRVRMVQDWSALVRTNLERAVTATRLDASTGDDEAAKGRIAGIMGRLNEDMAATAAATVALQEQVNKLTHEGAVAAAVAEVNQQRAKFVTIRAQVRDDIQMGDGAKRVDSEMVPLAKAMIASLAKLGQHLDQSSRDASQALGVAVGRARLTLFASSLVAVAAAALLGWLTTRSITAPMREAVGIAQHIADGDLTASIVSDRPDEFGTLLTQLAQMQDRLHTTFGEIRRSADHILTTSGEVAGGNADLSARTDETASNLQQTASSIEQLAGAVTSSSGAASQADALARTAADVAVRGRDAVSRVVLTMNDISASSRQIADIVGIIDGIAFQTNILALNAAVEAARAGEQGRGFAVVASEVRNLAQRSAESAKQIKGLIATSVDKVEQGSVLVGNAGQTMDEIVTGVRRVSDIIGEITSRSGEQSRGIGEVNAAVTRIDQMTQQNAALVDRSAEAAVTLERQAHSLSEAVAVFRLTAA